MNIKHCAKLLMLILLLCCGGRAWAQTAPYKFDFGADLGASGYLGDANRTNPMRHAGLSGQLSARYIYDTRWAFRAQLGALGLSGNTADLSNKLPDGAEFKFSSTVYTLDIRAEFNFLPYGIGETYKRLRRLSPYLTVGLGFSVADPGNGVHAAPTLPMGMGVKYKLSERWNLGAEFTMTKAFSDRIDGLPDDLSGIKSTFYRNTDWYSRLTVGVSYEFGKRCETCHYVD